MGTGRIAPWKVGQSSKAERDDGEASKKLPTSNIYVLDNPVRLRVVRDIAGVDSIKGVLEMSNGVARTIPYLGRCAAAPKTPDRPAFPWGRYTSLPYQYSVFAGLPLF